MPRADAPGHHRRAVRRPGRPRPARQGRLADRARPRRATTDVTSTPTSSSSAPDRPGSPPPRPPPGSGARVILVDDQPEPGGCAAPGRTDDGRRRTRAWNGSPRRGAELAGRPDVIVLQRTTAFGSYDDNYVLAVERRTDHLGRTHRPHGVSRQRHLAHPGPAGRPGHRRPRTPAGLRRQRPPGHHARRAARDLPEPLRRRCRAAGRGHAPPTTAPTPRRVDLADAGIDGRRRRRRPPAGRRPLGRRVRRARHRGAAGHVRRPAPRARTGVTGVTSAPYADGDARRARRRSPATCCSCRGGWNPAVHLFSQARGQAALGRGPRRLRARRRSRAASVAGAARGTFGLDGCLAEGAGPARGPLPAAGFRGRPAPPVRRRGGRAGGAPDQVLWWCPSPTRRVGWTPSSSTSSATRPSPTSCAPPAPGCARWSTSSATPRSAPPTTRARPPASIASGIIAEALGADVARASGTHDLPAAVHAGGLRGPGRPRPRRAVRPGARHPHPRLARGARRACSRTSASGSGPGTTRGPARTWTPAVLRECARPASGSASWTAPPSARSTSAGPDAGEFLDRLYTNLMSSLKPGSARYGVMCGVDGMVFDDGTVLRLADDRFLHHHHHRQRRQGPGLDGGVGPDRVAGAAASTAPR